METNFKFNDGGRKEAGFKGATDDCVVRSIAIILNRPYKEIYDEVNIFISNNEKKIKGKSSSRTGIKKSTAKKLMSYFGFEFIALMGIGTGCKVHLKKDELPVGKIICRVSSHFVAVIDGIINDTYDCSRNGTRCVYGYYKLI